MWPKRKATVIELPQRREKYVTPTPMQAAVAAERLRLLEEGPPGAYLDTDAVIQNAIDRWLDPEPVDRSLVRNALWEMERHWWRKNVSPPSCVCGFTRGGSSLFEVMRAHREDILAQSLGLSIR